MTSFDQLAEPIRKYIRDKKWDTLHPIQDAAIPRILSTEKNIILASKTASGKTEAAFLPILTKVDFKTPGVKVLYISPLIALINDQFLRVQELCTYLDVPVTKWHGEANRTLKEKLIKHPQGVVLITPESIEAMFVNAPQNVKHLFPALEFVVIDEIHSFSGTDRGIQLKSILSRLKSSSLSSFRVVGLSATIGKDFTDVKKMTGQLDNTIVLRDKTAKPLEAKFKYFEMDGTDLPQKLLDDLYFKVKDQKVLIFPNSRGKAEEVAVRLKKISDRVKGHSYYFSHHSSVDKEQREYIEHFAKNNRRYPFAIACTSTLELGIDIGAVEKVVQIDATHSIASLVQRVGRSGRKDGAQSSLLLYATDAWSLLQSLACLSLYKEEFIEPAYTSESSYDILLHQTLSILKELSGCSLTALQERLTSNYAFSQISIAEISTIVQELIRKEIIEQIGVELIIGVEGERIVNTKDFYSVFKSEPSFKVINFDKAIGEIPLMSIIEVDENILLAARIWKVVDIDYKAKKVFVIIAKDGKKPKFFGSGGDIHPKIREKMLQLLMSVEAWTDLDEPALEAIRQLQNDFKGYSISDLAYDRPMVAKEGETILYTFQGSKVNRSLQFLLDFTGIEFIYSEQHSSFTLKVKPDSISTLLNQVYGKLKEIDIHLESAVQAKPALIEFSKWGGFLPISYQCRLLKEKHFDFKALGEFIEKVNFVTYTSN